MKYNIKAKPKDDFKSQLEVKVAEWLSYIKIPFIYEPFTFKTKIGNYTPDFYLPEAKCYIEVKPNETFFEDGYIKLLKQFCLEKESDILLITPNKTGIIEYIQWGNPNEEEPELEIETYLEFEPTNVYMIVCSNCGTKSFCSSYGSYHCRKCKWHEGDHDVSFVNETTRNMRITFQEYYGWGIKYD